MKAAEIRGLNDQQLDEQLSELHAEWRDLRFQEAVGKLMATSRIREIRKNIARIHTIRTEREREAITRANLAETSQAAS
jgi:large subunit ribosomal protein L29